MWRPTPSARAVALSLGLACTVVGCGQDESSNVASDAGMADVTSDPVGDLGPDGEVADDGSTDGGFVQPTERVEAFWGPAPDRDARLAVFDTMWDQLAASHGGFATTDIDWDQVRAEYRPAIEQAESKGRFYQLLGEIYAQLHDHHTQLIVREVCDFGGEYQPMPTREYWVRRPPVLQGAPPHAWLKLGVCVTPLEDERLLVYRVDPDNPAGLQPGDIVLGYDGVPWAALLDEIDAWKLPTCAIHAAANAAQRSFQLESVVTNPHLFQTLDVLRRGESSPESIPTDGFVAYHSPILCTDQLPVDGVEFPWATWDDLAAGETSVRYGRITGTNIGYVYAFDCMNQVEFILAIAALMDTEGLILDFRFNMGGSMLTGGLALLFDEDVVDHCEFWRRDSSSEEYSAMTPVSACVVKSDPSSYYRQPIAVLTGPHARSSGDLVPYLLSFHPRARSFGRSTNGSFSSGAILIQGAPRDHGVTATYSAMVVSDAQGNWLHRTESNVDESVWLTQDDAAAGVDTVVEAAQAWIEAQNAM